MKKNLVFIGGALILLLGIACSENQVTEPKPVTAENDVVLDKPAPEASPVVTAAPGGEFIPCPCAKGQVYITHLPGKPGEKKMCVKDGSAMLAAHLNHGDIRCCLWNENLPCHDFPVPN